MLHIIIDRANRVSTMTYILPVTFQSNVKISFFFFFVTRLYNLKRNILPPKKSYEQKKATPEQIAS